MNERIEDLYKQAQKSVIFLSNSKESKEKIVIEKFAELIVKECLDQCYNRGMNDELYAGQLKAASYIEQHFGVEE